MTCAECERIKSQDAGLPYRVYIDEVGQDYVTIVGKKVDRPWAWPRSEWIEFWERCKVAEETP